MNAIVAINKFDSDSKNEIELLKQILKENNIEMSLVECWGKGGEGAIDLANKVIEISKKELNFKFAYNLNESIKQKIEDICLKIYGATDVKYTDVANEKIDKINKLGYNNLPICMSKTQFSFSDNPKNLECTEPFSITIKDINLKAGAGFIVALTGNVITMPGLPKVPSAEKIDIDKNGQIIGLF